MNKSILQKTFFLLTLLPSSTLYSETIKSSLNYTFKDSFERNESQNNKEEIGNGWISNTEKYAPDHKQVDLLDGTLSINRHESASHDVSLTQFAPFTDATIKMKFSFTHEKDSLGISFRDSNYKKTKQGSLIKINISNDEITLNDITLTPKISKKQKNLPLSELPKNILEQLNKSRVTIPTSLSVDDWHSLEIIIEGDTLSLSINNTVLGKISSTGIQHPTKNNMRLYIEKKLLLDDFEIKTLH